MQSMENPFQITRADENIEEEAISVFKAQTSKNTSYVDCTNMVFMKRLDLDAIFSFDEVASITASATLYARYLGNWCAII